MQTPDLTDNNIEQIESLFPNVITETKDENGNIEKAVDFDLLKQILSKELVEEGDERYQLDWPGKKSSLLKANTPITKTLRPCREESVNFDTTENLYIEGDNFEVLKILQESYLSKVKVIYIDPPYNTGSDFIYKDDFKRSKEEYEEDLGVENEEGEKLFKNTDSNGRFHSDWLSMMHERLVVARDLMREDGVIFISIGQNELSNLISLTDNIFGEDNRIAVVGRLAKSGGNKGNFFSPNIEYIIVAAKNIGKTSGFRDDMDDKLIKKVYTKIQNGGQRDGEKYRAMGLYQSSLDPMRGCINQRYYVEAPDGTLIIPPGENFPLEKVEGSKVSPKSKKDGVWRWTYGKYQEEFRNGNVEFNESNNDVLYDSEGNFSKWNVNTKIWLNDRVEAGQLPNDFISKFENRHSAKELKDLGIPFEFAKPVGLISYLVKISNTNNDDIVLDFFSGSATTAHAVMHLNSEDGSNRKFIMVQLPEKADEKSEAYKAGYKTISDLGKERIRKAGKNILESLNSKTKQLKLGEQAVDKSRLDIGFRVYKTDSTNIKDVFYHPNDLKQDQLNFLESNIKEDRTAEDLLTQVIIDLGLELSLPIEKKEIHGNNVCFVQTNALVACFDDSIDFKVVDEIAEIQPLKVVFKNASFRYDKDRINVEERFKRLSPETKVTVI